MKLRALLILATMLLGGMLLSGVVLAVTKTCNNNCKGTNSTDGLTGSNSKNELHGLGGGDVVKGLRGDDWLYGEGGDDELSGGPGFDGIYGGIGIDRLNGEKSSDHLEDIEYTPYSTAQQTKNPTFDTLLGGGGNDTIRANDGKKDIIRGGTGYDKAYVDRVDKVTGVEKEVVRGTGGGPPQPKQCQDGKDNDGDGKIDFGNSANNDPGCASATDDIENTEN